MRTTTAPRAWRRRFACIKIAATGGAVTFLFAASTFEAWKQKD
jgi:hypothetical protein